MFKCARLLFGAATCPIHLVKRFSPLKSWAARLAGSEGFKKAAAATARKIAVLMSAMPRTENCADQWFQDRPTLNSALGASTPAYVDRFDGQDTPVRQRIRPQTQFLHTSRIFHLAAHRCQIGIPVPNPVMRAPACGRTQCDNQFVNSRCIVD